MKQLYQNIRSGELKLEDVPPPTVMPGCVKIRTSASLISAGTEKMLTDLGRKSMLGKAKARPDLVRQVMNKARNEGVRNTYRNVKSKLERPLLLGYSAAGSVLEVGEGVTDLITGDRVAMGGAGYANHAEINVVPRNLVVPIPAGVTFSDASYATVASIALQGVRLARPQIGESCLVLGLGLIGLITIQILRANGCRVIGMDVSPEKEEAGLRAGAQVVFTGDPEQALQGILENTNGHGCDHTLVTAATSSNQPVEFAGDATRRKGQVVIIGAVGLQVPRASYYQKELSLQVSMSYGPGRYDPNYEEGGVDYPFDYVRWTEQRNMSAVLNLIADGKLDVSDLTTHHFRFERAKKAYDLINSENAKYIGIVLDYPGNASLDSRIQITPAEADRSVKALSLALIGAGNYASLHLLPRLKRSSTKVSFHTLVTTSSPNARQKAERFGFLHCTTETRVVMEDPDINTIFCTGRHADHAPQVLAGLRAGKNVFVEKPLASKPEQLDEIELEYTSADRQKPFLLMVGLNRRFAPMITIIRDFLPAGGARQIIYRVNAGFIPNSTWLHDPEQGGGMLVGEMCHFLDLMQFLCREKPVAVFAQRLESSRDDIGTEDNLSIIIRFQKGSLGTLHYSTLGDKAAPKEHLEIMGGGCMVQMEDFRRLYLTKNGRTRKIRRANQDKGQDGMVEATLRAFQQGSTPIPFPELVDGMRMVFAVRESLRSGQQVTL